MTAAQPDLRPVFYSLTLPGGKKIACMREDAFRRALSSKPQPAQPPAPRPLETDPR